MKTTITDKRYIDYTHIEIELNKYELAQLVSGDVLYCCTKQGEDPNVVIKVV